MIKSEDKGNGGQLYTIPCMMDSSRRCSIDRSSNYDEHQVKYKAFVQSDIHVEP
jgi:hypothetical protein